MVIFRRSFGSRPNYLKQAQPSRKWLSISAIKSFNSVITVMIPPLQRRQNGEPRLRPAVEFDNAGECSVGARFYTVI